MIEGGNDLVGKIIRSILPAPGDLPRAGSQGDTKMAFKYLQGQRCHHVSRQLLLVLSYSHSKNVFPGVWSKPPVSVCDHYLWSCQSAPLKLNFFHIFYTIPSGICSLWCDPLWAFISPIWLSSSSSLILSSYERFSSACSFTIKDTPLILHIIFCHTYFSEI